MVSAYEAKRLENIQRNHKQLSELGFEVNQVQHVSKQAKKASSATKIRKHSQATTQQVLRRSARFMTRSTGANSPRKHIRAGSGIVKDARSRMVVSRVALPTMVLLDDESIQQVNVNGTTGPSSKLVEAHVEKMQKLWVGKVILPPEGSNSMKAAVMNSVGKVIPTFSKYSGIQQFSNAILLFVNVGGESYENLFSHNEQCITWFAQSRQHPETPVIQRITSSETPVFLFCRFVGNPYVCCGPLQLVKSNLDVSPMRFVWNIVSWSDLVKSSKPFVQLLQA